MQGMSETTTRPTFQSVQEKIRRNFPKEHKPLLWQKVTDRIIRSACGRFQVEKRGDGPQSRYYAFIRPDTVIGYRMGTPEQAKEICDHHAAALLKPPPAPIHHAATDKAPGDVVKAPDNVFPVEREPGSDDDRE